MGRSLLDGSADQTQALGSDTDAPAVEKRHGDGKTLPLVAETALSGKQNIVKAQFGGYRAV